MTEETNEELEAYIELVSEAVDAAAKSVMHLLHRDLCIHARGVGVAEFYFQSKVYWTASTVAIMNSIGCGEITIEQAIESIRHATEHAIKQLPHAIERYNNAEREAALSAAVPANSRQRPI